MRGYPTGTIPTGIPRSKDLAKWEYVHPFLEDDQYGLIGDDGACPYFWPIDDRLILLHFSHRDRGRGHDRDSLITIDSSYSSALPDVRSRAPETAPVYLESGEPLKLRVFVDRSVVEVFVNGKQCIAVRVYPGREDSVGLSLRSQGRDALLKSLDAWRMKSIYGQRDR